MSISGEFVTLAGTSNLSAWAGNTQSLFQTFFWPLLVAGILVWLICTGLLKSIILRMHKLSAGTFSLDLSESGATTTRQTTEDNFVALRIAINRECTLRVREIGIRELLQTFVAERIEPSMRLRMRPDETRPNYRCTIHIQDPLFQDYLLQLVDYLPTGGGAGRSVSSRSGLVGRAWRSSSSMHWNDRKGEIGRDTLILEFGMTQEEADRSYVGHDQRASFLAIKMKTELSPRVGIIYLDSSNPNAFGIDPNSRQAFTQELEEHAKDSPLACQTLSLVKGILKISPQIDIGLSRSA